MERNGATDWLPHAILWLGIVIVAFPIYLAFVASTLTPQEIAQAPMSMLPGATWSRTTEMRCCAAACSGCRRR
jgi:ABC-type glycerol-3-phosphate transport system permease component